MLWRHGMVLPRAGCLRLATAPVSVLQLGFCVHLDSKSPADSTALVRRSGARLVNKRRTSPELRAAMKARHVVHCLAMFALAGLASGIGQHLPQPQPPQ